MIGSKLRTLRSSRKITQMDMAKLLGCARTTYTQYETGVSEPDFETLVKLADYFNVSVDYLLGRTDSAQPAYTAPPAESDDDIKVALFGGAGEVTPEMWDEVLNFIEFVKEKERKKNENK